jgi:hypothetical protein
MAVRKAYILVGTMVEMSVELSDAKVMKMVDMSVDSMAGEKGFEMAALMVF